MDELFSIERKNIVVVGGNGGIGSALVAGFLERSARVIAMDRSNEAIHKEAVFKRINLMDPDNIAFCVDETLEEYGAPAVLINCAGVTTPMSDDQSYSADWRSTMSVNLDAVFFISHRFSQRMVADQVKGSIINVTSIGGHQGFPNNPAYVASKGAVRMLSRALAMDFGKFGIRVNNLVPGYTRTPMNEKSWNDEVKRSERAVATILGRWAEPREFVGPAIFLASDASSYITGTDIIVDGGWLAKGL